MSVIQYHWRTAKAFRKGRRREIAAIVLHSTDGHKEGDIATLTGPKVSVHWYVTKTGEIWHFVDNADTAYHAGKVFMQSYSNDGTIGIEQEHLDGQEEWKLDQVLAVAQLVTALRQKHGQLPVTSHAAIAAPKGRKQDPLDYPWDYLERMARAAETETWAFERIV